MKKVGAATVAGAAAVALAAGLTSPAAAGTTASPQHRAAAAKLTPHHRITLITGDRVTVDAGGHVIGLQRAEGREDIPVAVRNVQGHTLVIPADAARLVATGKLDQRLFDITELNKPATRASQRHGLKVIVGYRGAARAAKQEVRDAGTLRRSLGTLNADAVQTPEADAPELWDAVTDGDRTAAGVAHVWLDGVRRVTLDKSTAQIGAPKAWAAGYTGKGVKIAVLDTGVDATHPDLKSQVIASKNFTSAATATDRFGHGTHVASIAAGTGAKSRGTYKGVAPGAKILNGKVLDDEGSGDDSGILAGMEWAAAQGADVVNLSLGGPDGPGVDPLEAAVDKLSAEKGMLFAIAAGNSGPETVGSPGSADAALTVGAVDDRDRLAPFSSTGPRVGDGAIKPDVTAPGVDITAASAKGSVIAQETGEKPAGYVTISGTSMATPHVAGAAAILKQQHPEWTYAELKGVLTASTKGGKYTAFEQGAGRVQIDRALKQSVIAEPVSVGFGTQQWPHTDDTPVTKNLTYRNLGTRDVTLNLKVSATNPKGATAPAGFFALAADRVTVPAGGTASVGVTVNTRLGGTVDGAYSAYVTATGGGQSVRTAAAVNREVESYDVRIRHVGKDGSPTGKYVTALLGYGGLASGRYLDVPQAESGVTTVRVPRGTYGMDAWITEDLENFKGGIDWLVQPKLVVTRDLTLTVDARRAKAADITVPDRAAKPRLASVSYSYDAGGFGIGFVAPSFGDMRIAHMGPSVTGLAQTWFGQWTKGRGTEWDVALTSKVSKVVGARTKHFTSGELATVKSTLAAATPGKTGAVSLYGVFPEAFVGGMPVEQKLPGTRTAYVSTAGGIMWGVDFEQYGGRDPDGFPVADAYYTLDRLQTYRPGRKYATTFNKPVFGPKLSSEYGLYRAGNRIGGMLPLFADSAGHTGFTAFTSATTSLYRNGHKVGSHHDPLLGEKEFTVTPGDAEYRLTTSVRRSSKVAAASTRIDASWTFRSKKSAKDMVSLPASSVRFGARTGSDGRVKAGVKQTVPVSVQGAARGSNLKSLAVYVSYDYGKTWKKVTVTKGRITVKNPARNKAVSFRARITDKKNNKSTVSIYNAYYGK